MVSYFSRLNFWRNKLCVSSRFDVIPRRRGSEEKRGLEYRPVSLHLNASRNSPTWTVTSPIFFRYLRSIIIDLSDCISTTMDNTAPLNGETGKSLPPWVRHNLSRLPGREQVEKAIGNKDRRSEFQPRFAQETKLSRLPFGNANVQ